jgi:hypothetical protein
MSIVETLLICSSVFALLAVKRPDFGDHQSHRDERKFFATKLI